MPQGLTLVSGADSGAAGWAGVAGQHAGGVVATAGRKYVTMAVGCHPLNWFLGDGDGQADKPAEALVGVRRRGGRHPLRDRRKPVRIRCIAGGRSCPERVASRGEGDRPTLSPARVQEVLTTSQAAGCVEQGIGAEDGRRRSGVPLAVGRFGCWWAVALRAADIGWPIVGCCLVDRFWVPGTKMSIVPR